MNLKKEMNIEIGPLEKKGDKLIKALEKGKMVAVLSGDEVMYVCINKDRYQTVIHKFGEEDARGRLWEMDERNQAMLKNLDAAADQFFEIAVPEDSDLMSVMVAAERGIYNFLCTIGEPPGEDLDFMEGIEK